MQKYQNNIAARNGDAVVGIKVLIKLAGTATPATIYSDDGVTTTPNPLTTNANGYFEFYVANGLYDIAVNGTDAYTDVLIADALGIDADALKKTEAAAPDGATKVGSAEGGTVQDALDGRVKQAELSSPATVPAYAFSAAEAQSIFDNALPMQNYTALRAYSGRALGVRVTAVGIGGMFLHDASDLTSADNGGTIILDVSSRRWKRQLTGVVDLAWFGGNISSGLIDVAPIAQAVASLCDSGKKRYLHISNWDGSFNWGSTVTFTNPGVRIYGDQSGSYNRGTGKDGWQIGQSGLTRFLDLGASRTTGNPADNWQVDGLSFKQAVGVTVRTIDGISFTSRTNGPDRAAIIRDTSFIGLRDAITIENPDIATVLASMIVEGCVIQGCRSALNAKGHLFNLRFVGNQCEQNQGDGATGVIGGSINGGVTITDNMLEGQPNVVSIDIPPVTGNRPAVLFARNYLEANSGSYLLRFRCNSSRSSLEVGPNFISGTPTFADYVLFENSQGAVTFVNNDPYPCTIKNSAFRLQYGSKPFNARVRGYEIRQLSAVSSTPEIVLAEFANLTDDAAAWTHGLPVAGTTAMTPFGVRDITPGGTNLAVTMAVAAGDLVCVNVLMRVRLSVAGSFSIYVRNESSAFLRGGGGVTDLATELNGRWALVSLPFIAQAAATTVRVMLNALSGTYPSAIAGVTVRNYGAFLNDGSTKVLIEPAVPNVV
jgi:hypothetical protein